jgi:DNA-binding transcriptional ArsR family regulator
MDTKKDSLIPNSSQVPNNILDHLIPRIPEAEARCLLYICRRTYGFHKSEDDISFSQFEKGIKTSQGKQLDFGTGLTRPSISTALMNLTLVEAITVQKRSRGNRYRLNLAMDVDKVVILINQLRKLSKTSKEELQKLVYLLNLQNLVNSEKPSLSKIENLPVDNLGKLIRDLANKMNINKYKKF